MRRLLGTTFLGALLVTVAACTSDDAATPATDEPANFPTAAEIDASNYSTSWQVCETFGIDGTAQDLGLDSTDPSALAQAYAERSYTPDRQPAAYEGCLAGLEGRDPPPDL